ncbi:MAG: DUF3341 domain-containing protein [Planctomycetota bacterium]|nr:DUF3341 domain-containing protein [Planctomycetota bacterium]
MSATVTASKNEKRLLGLIAEFASPESLVSAGTATREEGYRRLEAFSPFPVHGIDRAIGVRPTPLPWLVLGAGITGALVALAGQWFTNAFDYPFLISGKPLFSLPANIPVTFEVIILVSAVTAFLGVLALNGLPRFSNPLFSSQRFLRATHDRFFLLVQAADPRFSEERTAAWLNTCGAIHVEPIWETDARAPIPKLLYAVGLLVATLALLPPLLIARSRATTSASPRLTIFSEMFFQPKFKTQTPSALFADGRAMRPPVSGTVARGQLQEDDRLVRGLEPGASVAPGVEKPELAEPNWTKEMPLPVTPQLMQRGRQQFNIYCATCHGRAGFGDGVASQRALRLQQGTWLPPSSLHAEPVRQQSVGKLFSTITNGIRKMPAYGSQIAVPDRWAIVLYVRALQRSQDAALEDAPADRQQTLQGME